MPVSAYVTGVALLLAVAGSVGFAGWRLRVALLPAWSGPPAILAGAIAAIATLSLTAQLAGSVGQFRRIPLAVACLAVAVIVGLATRPRRTASPAGEAPPRTPAGRGATLASLVAVAAVAAEWSGRVAQSLSRGIKEADSLQHHLPFAARFVQEGWLTRLHFAWLDPVWAYYPSNAELLQGIAILPFHRDAAVPLINLGWLALGLLAGWCAGRPWGVAPATMTAVAVVAALPVIIWTQAGTAGNDVAVLALWVSALALLVQRPLTDPVHVGFAGLAAGLAVATKLTLMAPIAVLTVALVVLAPRGARRRTLLWWASPLLVAGGFWFVRNVMRTGSPIPVLHLPGLPSPRLPVVEKYGLSVAHYLLDGHFWRDVVPSGLNRAFGIGWPVLVALVVGGLILALVKGPAPARAAAIVAIVAGGAYTVTPLSASGPPGVPWLFWANLRYLLPALIVALLMLPVLPALRIGNRARWVLGVYVATLAATLAPAVNVLEPWLRSYVGVAFAAAAAVIAGGLLLPRISRRAALAVCLAVALVGLGAGLRVERRFEARRYATVALALWADTVHGARIGVVGISPQYPLHGVDLSNRVEYIGRTGPHGSFASVRTCRDFRAVVAEGRYDYVVTGTQKWHVEPAPEGDWMREDPAATLVLNAGSDLVFRVQPGAPPTPCP